MLLLRKLGASLEEQLASLLHDISTFAVSHVADWVFAELMPIFGKIINEHRRINKEGIAA